MPSLLETTLNPLVLVKGAREERRGEERRGEELERRGGRGLERG